MTATNSALLVAKRIMRIIELKKEELLLGGVLYGDHRKIPYNRTVCVIADTKRRALRAEGVPRMTSNTFQTQVLIYHGNVENVEENLEACDELAETIETLIHEYPRLTDPDNPADTEGLVTHCLVTIAEPGTRTRSENNQWKVHRLTVESMSLTRLPSL